LLLLSLRKAVVIVRDRLEESNAALMREKNVLRYNGRENLYQLVLLCGFRGHMPALAEEEISKQSVGLTAAHFVLLRKLKHSPLLQILVK
jgi:hypothetical protein